MLGTRFYKHISRTDKNLAVAITVLLALILGFVLLTLRANFNLLFGPFQISKAKLIELTDPTTLFKYRVTVDADAVSNVIYEQYRVYYDDETGEETDRYVRASYQFLALDKDHILLLKTSEQKTSPLVSGALVPIPNEIVVEFLEKTDAELKKKVLPMMLDNTRFSAYMTFPLYIFIPLVLLVLWKLFRLIQRKRDVTCHPVYKALAAHGKPDEIAEAIDEDIITYQAGAETPRATVTKNWIICPSRFDISIGKMDKMIWAYKKVTEHSIWHIPVGVTVEAVFKFSDGKSFGFSGQVKNVDRTLEKVARYLPYIYLEYDVDFSFLFDRDRQKMIDQVMQAKSEYEKQMRASKTSEENETT